MLELTYLYMAALGHQEIASWGRWVDTKIKKNMSVQYLFLTLNIRLILDFLHFEILFPNLKFLDDMEMLSKYNSIQGEISNTKKIKSDSV